VWITINAFFGKQTKRISCEKHFFFFFFFFLGQGNSLAQFYQLLMTTINFDILVMTSDWIEPCGISVHNLFYFILWGSHLKKMFYKRIPAYFINLKQMQSFICEKNKKK